MRLFRRHPITTAVVLVGAALVVAGAVALATAGPVSFGWFANAPLPDAVSLNGAVIVDTPRRVALATMTVGALLLSAAAGYAVGRRRATTTRGTTDA